MQRHPAGLVIGIGLFPRQQPAQSGLLGALLASVVLHGVLLMQLKPGIWPHPVDEPASLVLTAHLRIPAPSLKQTPPVVSIAPIDSTTAAKQGASFLQPVSVADAPFASPKPEQAEPTPSTPSRAIANSPLDLSPQVLHQSMQRNSSLSLAQAAREQLGDEPASAVARLGQHIASGAVPDCLHSAPDGETKSRPVAIGGLLALPFLAYSAIAGKCK